MKNKNLLGIFFTVVLFVGGFLVGDRVEAVQCCLMESIPENTPLDCRSKGSTLCNQTIQEDVGNCAGEIGCNDREASAKEREVLCTAYPVCISKLTTELNDCTGLDSTTCNALPALCFYSKSLNKCLSKSDSANCLDANATDCGYLEPAGCKWVPDVDGKDGQCLSALGQGVRNKYTNSSNLLPGCTADGSCRKLSDIIGVALKAVDLVFKYVGAIAFIFFVYGGFTMILSFGNSEKFKKGQQVLVAAVIGLIIVFGAYLMVSFILDALGVAEEFKVIK